MIKNILYLSILTTFVIISWIGFNVYHHYITSTISTDTGIKILPITPAFDTKTLEMLKTRRPISVDLHSAPILPTQQVFQTAATQSAETSPLLQETNRTIATSSGQFGTGSAL